MIFEGFVTFECEIWYLPPYSPDFNKIECWWFVFKNWMRQWWDEFDSFRECVDAAFNQCPKVYAQRHTSSSKIFSSKISSNFGLTALSSYGKLTNS